MASASGIHAQVLVTAQIPQTPPTKAVKLALFTNLRGIEELIAKIRSGGLDFAVLDARTVSCFSVQWRILSRVFVDRCLFVTSCLKWNHPVSQSNTDRCALADRFHYTSAGCCVPGTQ